MKILKFLIAVLIIIAMVLCIIKIRNSFYNIPNTKDLKDWVNSVMQNIDIKRINSGVIQNSLSWKMNEAKWFAEQYYNDVLKDYVDKTKEWISGAAENAKWYYNQWVDNLWNTITNEINTKIVEWLDKIKVK